MFRLTVFGFSLLVAICIRVTVSDLSRPCEWDENVRGCVASACLYIPEGYKCLKLTVTGQVPRCELRCIKPSCKRTYIDLLVRFDWRKTKMKSPKCF